MGKSNAKEHAVESKLLSAARTLFTAKGFAGTNMREIAERAGVNKGLIHYYDWNKSKLFMAVFADAFHHFARQANALFVSEQPLPEKLEAFIDRYIDFLSENPHLPGFILSELNSRPEAFMKEFLGRVEPPDPAPFLRQLEREIRAGRAREVNALHFFLNLLSMCLFPFAARPLVQTLFNIPSGDYDALLQARKREVLQASLAVLYPNGNLPRPTA